MLYASLKRAITTFPTKDGAKKLIIDEWLFESICDSAVQTIEVDEEWYCDAYPDVKAAIKAGEIASCKVHFTKYGYKEGRLPFRIVVDQPFYLRSNSDVLLAIGGGAFANAQDHFDRAGHLEGREPYENFSYFLEKSTQ